MSLESNRKNKGFLLMYNKLNGEKMNKIIVLFVTLFSVSSLAVLPRYNIDPYSHYYTAEQTFAGGMTLSSGLTISDLADVSGDAVCMSGANLMGTCTAAVFTTSVSSPIILSATTAGTDDILIKPAGTTAATFAETTGNLTIVGDITVTGNDITLLNVNSAATGGADDISLKPAGTAAFNVNEAGDVQVMQVVTTHAACAAAGDRGRIELFGVADTVSFCGCWQSAAATYAWVALHVGGVC